MRGLIAELLRRHRPARSSSAAQADRLCESALACRARGDENGARALCEQALVLVPGHPGSHYLLGVIHAQGGDAGRSLHHLEQAAAQAPDWPDAHLGHGNARQLAGDLRGAEESYRRALALAPHVMAPHYSLGLLLRRMGRNEDALPHLARAHELEPGAGEIAWDLVQLLLEVGEHSRARAIAQETVSRNGTSPAARKALGLALLHLHEPQPAREEFARCAALAPDDAEAHLHQGIADQELARLDDALAAYERALEVKPGYPQAMWRRSLVELMRGEFASGWTDYEVRHLSESRPQRRFPQPRWQGEPLAGRTLLVHAEQGLGDEIMFASCLPDVTARAHRCVIDCHPKLAPLFERSFPSAVVHAGLQTDDLSWLDDCPPADYQIPAGSLPGLLRRRPGDFPRHQGYLRADPAKTAAWRARLDALGPGLKVGLSWQGGTALSRAPLRSLSLEQLMPVLRVAGVHFVDLQYTDSAGERAALEQESGVRVAHWPQAIADYDETAALVTALDLVVSVCTAVIHLAGALGRPVWVMTPYSPEWRYGHAGERMPWYPSVQLVRQARFREWGPVIEGVARQLAELRAVRA